MIERSRVDNRWCIYTKYSEMLVPFWGIPIGLVLTGLFYLQGVRYHHNEAKAK